jgi:alpha-tubulin suppressor-like RCC1 family protein
LAATPLTGVSQLWKGGFSVYSCAIMTIGGIKCWGLNISGQLGDGSTTDRHTPVDVIGLTSGVATIALGDSHTCALTTDGGVKCWGWNVHGELGDGSTIDSLNPIDVSSLTSGVSAIALGSHHSCALTTSGGVKCWGSNAYGQLGDGSTIDSLNPIDVSGLTSGVSAIALGEEHSCALTTSGGIKCWGDNSFAQLGDGSTTNSLIPVDVKGLTSGVSAIALGYFHSCALTMNGEVKCWGYNLHGQLGDGSTTDSLTPIDVSGLTSRVSAITLGYGHSCALTTTGGIKCWGRNAYGELGDGSTIERHIPDDVSGLTSGVIAIALGGSHSCALTTTSGIKCWGFNFLGQLGDNSTTDRHTPVDVVILAPEIDIQGNNTSITNGDTTPNTTDLTDFGGTLVGMPISRTFTIVNTGEADLNLLGTPLVALTGFDCTAFRVTTQPTTPVAATHNATFTIEYNPSIVGIQTCTVNILNDDSDENSYDFKIRGEGIKEWGPEPIMLGNLSAINVEGNSTHIAAGDTTPDTTDNTDFGSTPIGIPVSKTFTITNIGRTTLSLPGPPSVALIGTDCEAYRVTTQPLTTIDPIIFNPQSGTTFTIEYSSLVEGTYSCMVSIRYYNQQNLEKSYNFSIQGTSVIPVVMSPEINLQGNGINIMAGDTNPTTIDNTNFGNTLLGIPVSKTFTIANTGGANLNLSGTPPIALTGSGCAAFRVTIPPLTPVAASGDTTFTIEYQPTTVGTHICTVSIVNDDSNENPYDFNILGKTTWVANDDNVNTTPNIPVTITVLSNDDIPEANLNRSNLQITTLPLNGTLIINPDNTIIYSSKPGIIADQDSFIYQLCDNDKPPQCTTATVSITIFMQLPPVAANLSAPLTLNNAIVQLPSLAAQDLDGSVTYYTITTLPSPIQGLLYLDNPDKDQLVVANQEIKLDQVGQLFFQPANQFIGTASFTYTATDDKGAISNFATVTIPVTAPLNFPPLVHNDTGNMLAETSVIIPILLNDSDPEGFLDTNSLSIVAPPPNGRVEINLDKTVTYTPNTDFTTGTDTFSYQVCDTGIPPQCAQATVSVTVSMPANLPPIADNKTAATASDTSVQLPPLSATDVDGSIISYLIMTLPLATQGILYLGDPQATGQLIELEQKVTPNDAHKLFFQPHPNTAGEVIFDYLAIDDQGEPSTTATVTISVTVPVPPVIDEAPAVTYQPPPTAIDDAQFSGKIWSNSGKVGKRLSIDAPEYIQLTGSIQPSSKHIGQIADIRVIYNWKSNLDNQSLILPVTLASQQPLATQMNFNLFAGYLIGLAGQFEIRLGYQLNNGTFLADSILNLEVYPNNPPTEINLSHQTVLEYSPTDTLIGSFTTTDPDNQEQFRYGLVNNPGDYFKVVGKELRVNYSLPSQADYPAYPITVRSVDLSGGSLEKSFLIQVLNTKTQPQEIYLTQNTIMENSPGGTIIGRLWTLDSQPSHYFYKLLDDAQGQFILDGDLLRVAPEAILDFETQPTYAITVRSWKAESPAALEKTFSIYLTNQIDVTVLLTELPASQGESSPPPTNLTGQEEVEMTIQLLPELTHQGKLAEIMKVMFWQPLASSEIFMYRSQGTQWIPWHGDLVELLTGQVVTLQNQHEMTLVIQPPFDWNQGEINLVVGYQLPTEEIFYATVPWHSTFAKLVPNK